MKSITTPFDGLPDQARALTSTDLHHVFAIVSLKDDYATARSLLPGAPGGGDLGSPPGLWHR